MWKGPHGRRVRAVVAHPPPAFSSDRRVVPLEWLARLVVEQQHVVAFVRLLAEVEHVQQAASVGIARAPAAEPEVVLNEARDRALIGRRVIDEVGLREWRDDKK